MDLRERFEVNPDNPNLAFVEFSAAGFEHHAADCIHCLELANPQLDDFLSRTKALAMLETAGEDEYRRKRLCQAIRTNTAPFIRPEVWDGLEQQAPIPDGAEVVIGLDGAFGGRDSDACALVIGTVSRTPHFDVLACYENPGDPNWRVDLLQVEADIRQAAKKYRVREVVMDPFRLGRTGQILQAEGLTVSEFPWSASRATKATTALHSAALAGEFTHSGNETLTRHVLASTVIESNGGLRIGKTSRKRSAAKIDCAAALLMCHSRCTWLASRKKRNRAIGV